MVGIVGSCLKSVGKGVDASSLVSTEVNWDWRIAALSPVVSSIILPSAANRDGMPTRSFVKDLM